MWNFYLMNNLVFKWFVNNLKKNLPKKTDLIKWEKIKLSHQSTVSIYSILLECSKTAFIELEKKTKLMKRN